MQLLIPEPGFPHLKYSIKLREKSYLQNCLELQPKE